jgi:hypothetical protein
MLSVGCNVRERLSVRKRTVKKFYMERLDLKYVKDMGIEEQLKISNRFAFF